MKLMGNLNIKAEVSDEDWPVPKHTSSQSFAALVSFRFRAFIVLILLAGRNPLWGTPRLLLRLFRYDFWDASTGSFLNSRADSSAGVLFKVELHWLFLHDLSKERSMSTLSSCCITSLFCSHPNEVATNVPANIGINSGSLKNTNGKSQTCVTGRIN